MVLSCSDFGQAHGDRLYSFAQRTGESLEECAIRAMNKIKETGLNREGHFRGTNHIAAHNAACAFPAVVLKGLEADAREDVRKAAKVISMWQVIAKNSLNGPMVNAIKDRIDGVLGVATQSREPIFRK